MICQGPTAYQGPYPPGPVYGGYPPMGLGTPVMDNKAAMDADFYARAHARQFSQATTATPGNGAASVTPPKDAKGPGGQGEQSYGEWLSKVEGGDGAPAPASAARRPPYAPASAPYVSYPNDPYNYYTINGRHPAAAASYRPY